MTKSRLTELCSNPLALYRPALTALLARIEAEPLTLREPYKVDMGFDVHGKSGGPANAGAVAVLPIDGVLSRRDRFFGTATESVSAALQELKGDSRIGGVLLDIDSPGGDVLGIEELANEIRAFAKVKPIGAHTGGMMASAAYWLGSQADFVTASAGAMVGSIGIYSVHEDLSAMAAEKGVKMTFISAGEHKVDGNPFEPLSDSAREQMQANVDHYYGLFTNAVAKGRGVTLSKVLSDFGQGKVFNSTEAKKNGLIDAISNEDKAVHAVATQMVKAAHMAGEMRRVDGQWTIVRDDEPVDHEDEPVKDDDTSASADLDRRRRNLSLQRQKAGLRG